jgi:hypothetical protein
MGKAYVRSKIRIESYYCRREYDYDYSHFVKTVENPREEMFLAHFMTIWEIKDKII